MDLLRSTLQPISQNLPRPVHDAAIALLGRECHQTLLVDLDLTSSGCVKLAVSKGLGVGIIAASAVVKVPQILKLVSSRSAAGVSFLSYLLETVAFVVSLAYNARQGFPFSTYGETALIAAQNVVIAVLVLALKGRASAAAAFVAGLAAALYALLFKGDAVVDLNGLKWLQAGAGVLGVASKAPQIWTVWKEGGTGQLSAFAVFNYLAGSLSRIFTTLQEVDDKLILYGFVAGFILNAVLAAQMLYYWNSPTTTRSTASRNTPWTEKDTYTSSSSSSSHLGSSTARAKGPSTRRRG